MPPTLPAALLFLLAFSPAAHAADPLLVRTDKGRVQGILTEDGKVRAFLGIPYAAPPVEELRWKAPEPAEKWKGVMRTTNFGAHCIQSVSYPDMVFHDPGTSEDCLTVNVWTPASAKPGSLPVMVWIYGGGFLSGGTSESRQDGQFLAHRNVVVVSMNYRLGVFGFMTNPELAEESTHHSSGNYGLLDQAAALDWVHRNIAAFGGNTDNVTLFGESAGSMSVSLQMASPLSQGLFQKAIGESGAGFQSPADGFNFPLREEREKRDAAYAESILGSSHITYLRALSVTDLLKAFTGKSGQSAPPMRPVVDGYFLPATSATIYADGRQAHIPLLAGWNSGEQRGSAVNARPTVESFAAMAHKTFGEDAPKFLAAYPATTDAEALESAAAYAGDQFIAFATWQWIEAQAKTGTAPVYRYFFDLASPGDRNHSATDGAFHSDDIEYVFGTLESRPQIHLRPEDHTLSDQIQQYWTNFARTGDPNGPGLPKWPTYTGSHSVLTLDAHPHAAPDPYRPRYEFLSQFWKH